MNQILQVQERKSNKKNDPIDTKKIVLFFAICIIIFGLFMGCQGAYSVYQNKINQRVENSQQPELPDEPRYVPPTINLTKTEDNKVIIDVQSEVAISHIIYDWNSGVAQTLDEIGKTSIEEIIEIPVGENVLNISVIDLNGKETKKTETYIVEVSKPVIELSVVGNDIKITVTSETELSYVTYKWNSEEEKKQDMLTFVDKTKFEKNLEIPKGQNTLKIVAVDKNENKTEKSQEIKGVTKAKTTAIVRGEYLHFNVIGEENIKTVVFEFNGEKFIMDTNTFGTTKKVQYKVKMVKGWNYLKIISKTQSDAIDTTWWKFEYKGI